MGNLCKDLVGSAVPSQIFTTWVQIIAGLSLKNVSSFTLAHYLWKLACNGVNRSARKASIFV